ncbi:MAG: protease modulator HflK family protein [Spirochaetales bacterium]|nr:protease modulator HflK family protein [Spirochaetales bacterium]
MDIKERTASVSILLNIILAALKFVAFYFTASLAILGEAYHSLSDILTSVLVYVSLKEKRVKKAESGEEIKKKMPLENIISLAIGIFIFFVGIYFLVNVFVYPPIIIRNPLVSGIGFIIFAFGSYIVYRFETIVGKKENSLGLISDGMHSKTDMMTSFITGFSLILYSMGINLDVPVAVVIAFFIISFSIETIINVIIYQQKKTEEINIFHYKFREKITFVFNKALWISILKHINRKTESLYNRSSLLRRVSGLICLLIIAVCIIWYSTTCVYMLEPCEEGIIERFGKPVNYGNPILPGLHFKFPYPIDKVIKIDSKRIRIMNIGNETDENIVALLWTKKHGDAEAFLSGDNNFFYPYLVLHYRVKDIFNYHYKHKDPELLMENVAYNIITNIFTKKEFYIIATTYRKQFALDTEMKLQEELDKLGSGILITGVNMKDVHPPIFIADSFENVIVSIQQKEEIINEAYGYKNKSIPETKGEAEKIMKAAGNYAVERVKRSEGEGMRFKNQVESYSKGKNIIRKYLYLNMIKESLAENNKIIVEPLPDLPELWFNFDTIDLKSKAGD